MRELFISEDIGHEGLFFLLERSDFFLDAVFDDEPIGDDLRGLADTVGSINCLSFNGGVPPWIEEHDVACGCQV